MAQSIGALLTLVLVHTCTHAGGHSHWYEISADGSRTSPSQFTECRHTKAGLEYRGTLAVTRSQRQCQRWESQSPHHHHHTDAAFFPDALLKDAVNYCRNPSGSEHGPWCYTNDPNVRAELCKVPFCGCKRSKGGTEYVGTVSVTRSGHTCEYWDKQPSIRNGTHNFKFPDQTVDDAANYCRNPNGQACGPWCFTGYALLPWQYCGIPPCGGDVIIPTLPIPKPTDEVTPHASMLVALVVSGCSIVAVILLVTVGIRRRAHRDRTPLTTPPAEHRDDDMVYDNPLYYNNDTIVNVRVIQRLENIPDRRRY